jgi:hypothetical protein
MADMQQQHQEKVHALKVNYTINQAFYPLYISKQGKNPHI